MRRFADVRTGGDMDGYVYDVFPTELGWVGLLASPRGLRASTLPVATKEKAMSALGAEVSDARQDADALSPVRAAVVATLGGDADAALEVSLDLEGVPPFFRAAWEACRMIPSGETRSYGWLAAAAGRPGAARAAGQAMAYNRFSLIVPCHRVIGSDGSLHGYGGGLALKARLLALESGDSVSHPAA